MLLICQVARKSFIYIVAHREVNVTCIVENMNAHVIPKMFEFYLRSQYVMLKSRKTHMRLQNIPLEIVRWSKIDLQLRHLHI